MKERLAVLMLAIGSAATASYAGTYFSAVTTSDGPKGSAALNATVRGWVEGDKARVEFAESDSPILKPGLFLFTLDGGASTYLVDAKTKSFSRWDLSAVLSAEAAAPGGARGAVSRTFSQPKVEKVSGVDGGAVAGVPTRHVKYRATYTIETTVEGTKQTSAVQVDEDVWIAPGLADAALGLWLTRSPIRTGDDAFDASFAALEIYDGYPLKRVVVATTTSMGGKKTVVNSTLTVTELIAGEMPAGTFKMGSGLRETPLPLPGKPGEAPTQENAPAGDQTAQPAQDEDRYPLDRMLDQPESGKPAAQPQAGGSTSPQPKPGQPAPQPGAQPGTQPGTPDTPQPEPEPQPEYAFERMLDAPER